jgi:hypothetical protein
MLLEPPRASISLMTNVEAYIEPPGVGTAAPLAAEYDLDASASTQNFFCLVY